MFQKLFFFIVTFLGINFNLAAQGGGTPCVRLVVPALAYQSKSGANCTYNFTPTAVVESSPNVKYIEIIKNLRHPSSARIMLSALSLCILWLIPRY